MQNIFSFSALFIVSQLVFVHYFVLLHIIFTYENLLHFISLPVLALSVKWFLWNCRHLGYYDFLKSLIFFLFPLFLNCKTMFLRYFFFSFLVKRIKEKKYFSASTTICNTWSFTNKLHKNNASVIRY